MFINKFNIKTTYDIKNNYEDNEILLLHKFDDNYIKEIFIELPTKLAIEHGISNMKYVRGNSNLNFISNKFQIKIKINDETMNGYEQKVISKIDKYKYDYKFISNKSYIKKFYKGQIKQILSDNELKKLIKEIKNIHSINSDELISYDVDLPGKKVFCHGDLRPKNVIVSDEIKLIDFEWARKNSLYWDLASIIVNYKLGIKQKNLLIKEYGNIDKNSLNISINEVVRINSKFDEKKYYKIK